MGARAFTNQQAHEYLEQVVCSDRDKRHLARQVAADDQRWSSMASDQYSSSTNRLTRDLDAVVRICENGEETVDQILEDLRNGEITASEAAKALGAARRDLNKIRRVANEAEQTEEQVWAAVDCSPGEYQQRLMNRAPALFREGRNHLVLPTSDD